MKNLILTVVLVLFTSTTFAQEPKTTAAVMDLEAKEGISAGVVSMLSDYLRTQLVNTDKFIFITRENIESLLKEQKFQVSGVVSEGDVVEIGQIAGVRKMFAGSIGKVGTTYIITLKILDVQSGKIERAEPEECANCTEDALLISIRNITNKITGIKATPEAIPSSQVAQPKLPPVEYDFNYWFKRGVEAKNSDDKIKCLTKAIENWNQSYGDINKATVYFNRGLAYDGLDEYQKAIDDYSKAIELDPKYVSAYSHRGSAYYYLGQDQKAIDDHSKAIELNPKFATAYNNRGTAYCTLGEYQRAIDDYTKAIELNPENYVNYGSRGLAYDDLGKYQKAIDDYTKVIELSIQYPSAYYNYNRGRDYHKLGEYQKAIDDYTKAIELGPGDALDGAYYHRACAYSLKKEKDKALFDLKKAIGLNKLCKDAAKTDKDFKTLWDDPDFKKLVK